MGASITSHIICNGCAVHPKSPWVEMLALYFAVSMATRFLGCYLGTTEVLDN